MGISLGTGARDARSSYVTTWLPGPADREAAAGPGSGDGDRDGRGALVLSLSISSWLAASFWRHADEDG